jgi:hypothetical protein
MYPVDNVPDDNNYSWWPTHFVDETVLNLAFSTSGDSNSNINSRGAIYLLHVMKSLG